MKTIIIEVRGGVVQEVYSNASDLNVVLIDWDGQDTRGIQFEGGTFPLTSVEEMPESTRRALAHFSNTLP